MIASPSDTTEARDEVESAIYRWNTLHAQTKKIILQPWRYESSSVAVLGGHPQSLINSQGLDQADIVFALFGSRLGSPTPAAVSGTVEEIQRAIDQGKPVHLYFSSGSLPADVDTAQLEGLRAFKAEISERGLLGEFNDPRDLGYQVFSAIEHDIQDLDTSDLATSVKPQGVKLTAQPKEDREHRGFDKRGKAQYRTRRWIEVSNTGDVDAEDVTFEAAGEKPRMWILGESGPTVIHAGQTRPVSVGYTAAVPGPDILRIRWVEDGEQNEKDFHVG